MKTGMRVAVVVGVFLLGACAAWPFRRSRPAPGDTPAVGGQEELQLRQSVPLSLSSAQSSPSLAGSTFGAGSVSNRPIQTPPGIRADTRPAQADARPWGIAAESVSEEPDSSLADASGYGLLHPPVPIPGYPAGDAPSVETPLAAPDRVVRLPRRPYVEPVRAPPAEPVRPSRPVGASAARRHVVRIGDTLPALARQYLGRSDRYLEIYDFNRDTLASPDLLPLGLELKIPPAWPIDR